MESGAPQRRTGNAAHGTALGVRRKIVASDRVACRVAEPDRHKRQKHAHKQPQPLECSLRVVGICRAAVGKLALGLLFAALGALCLLLLMTLQLPAPLLRLFLRALRTPCRLLRLFGIARRRGLRVRLCLIGPLFFSVTSPQPINPQFICFILLLLYYFLLLQALL